MTRWGAAGPAIAALVLLTACTASVAPDRPEPPSPFADCTALTTAASAPAKSAPATSAASAPAASAMSAPATAASPATGASTPPAAEAAGAPPAAADLPDLTLPCFTGGAPVALRDLRGPAVINIWASWCEPCRTELPIMQGLADRVRGRLTVLGVNSADRPAAAADFAAGKGVTFPTLADRDGELAIAVKQTGLPATVFVGPDGTVTVHRKPLDVDELITQVREHTGVTVTR